MYKLNKIRGFVAMPIIIGSAVLAVGVLGGLAYEYKNNQFIPSVVNKNNLLAQVSGVTAPTITVVSPKNPSGNYDFTIPIGGTITLAPSWSWTNLQAGDLLIVNISKYIKYSESKTAGSIARVYSGTVEKDGTIGGGACCITCRHQQ